jgi:hypothetical protein
LSNYAAPIFPRLHLLVDPSAHLLDSQQQ